MSESLPAVGTGRRTEEIEITPEMIEAGVAAMRGLPRGDLGLMDDVELVGLILRASLDVIDFPGSSD